MVVGTVTEDFASAILSPDGEKKDRDYVAPKLAARYGDRVGRAETGMRLLERECTPLNLPTDIEVRETVDKLREIYSKAYGWKCSGAEGGDLAAPGIRTECATKSAPPSTNGTCCDSIRTLARKRRATSSTTRMKRTLIWNGNPKTMPDGSRIFLLHEGILNCRSLSTT